MPKRLMKRHMRPRSVFLRRPHFRSVYSIKSSPCVLLEGRPGKMAARSPRSSATSISQIVATTMVCGPTVRAPPLVDRCGAHPSPLILTTTAGSVCSVGVRRSTTDAERRVRGSWGARRWRRQAPPSQSLRIHHPRTWAPASWSGLRALDYHGVCSVCACSDPTRGRVQHIPCRTGTLLSLGTRPYHLPNRPIPPVCSRAGAHEPGAMLPLWIGLAAERPP